MMKKYLSRKFLLTLIGDIMGIVTILVGQNTVTTIVGAAAVIVVNVVYCIIEGCIDAKTVGQITDAAEDIAESLGAGDNVMQAIEKSGEIADKLVGDGGESTVEGE